MTFHSQIIAIGKMKARSPYAPAYTEYDKRLKNTLSLFELEGRDTHDERQKIISKLDTNAPIIALDELGKTLSSVELSKNIEKLQQIKSGKVQFIIGGADGLDDDIRARADLILSFGRLTWPHMLARVMLVEQIYRATLIMSNHPYHREG